MSSANEPAFPLVGDYGPECHGLTKLEYFAGLAMQGLLANPEIVRLVRISEIYTGPRIPAALQEVAVVQARALCAELEKTK